MEEVVAVEQRRPIRETPAEALMRQLAAFGAGLARLAALAALLTPVLLLSFLTLDIAILRFDQLVDLPAEKPSNWLSVGGLVMTAAGLMTILFARKFGGEEAARAVTASWGAAAVAVFAEIAHLAPTLQDADFPSVRFVVAFVASAMVGQYCIVAFYDVVRGGGPWWRAPLLSALFGFGAQSALFYGIAFWREGGPWPHWMIAEFGAKAAATIAFLPIYKLMRRALRPSGGFGGR
jgi:uncharacterized PurR-regulated membrane protein YhhQ (DUF165 family)